MDPVERAWRVLTAGFVIPTYGLTVKEYWRLSTNRHMELVAGVSDALNQAIAARLPEPETEPEPEGKSDGV